MNLLPMYRARSTLCLLALLVGSCATQAPASRSDPNPTRFAAMSLEELREAARIQPPECAKPFTECTEQKECTIVIAKHQWSREKRAAWAKCEDIFAAYSMDRVDVIAEIGKRDPFPRCVELSDEQWHEYGIDAGEPERELDLIAHGVSIGAQCLRENCEWADRNLPDVAAIADACTTMRHLTLPERADESDAARACPDCRSDG